MGRFVREEKAFITQKVFIYRNIAYNMFIQKDQKKKTTNQQYLLQPLRIIYIKYL